VANPVPDGGAAAAWWWECARTLSTQLSTQPHRVFQHHKLVRSGLVGASRWCAWPKYSHMSWGSKTWPPWTAMCQKMLVRGGVLHGSKPLTRSKISEISQWHKCFSALKISNPRISCTLNGVRRSSWKVVWVTKSSYASETSFRWQIFCSYSWRAIDMY